MTTQHDQPLRIWRNAPFLTLASDAQPSDIIEDGAIAASGEHIVFVGPENAMQVYAANAMQVIDCGGRVVAPALVDCHTHLVVCGDRAMEFEMRLAGSTYGEVAGAGFISSVKATNALSVEGLVEAPLPRLDTLLSEGVSAVEIKSGYGLSIEGELNMLRAARTLERPVLIATSDLATHPTPVDYKGRNDDYIADVVPPGFEQAHAEGLVDGFCEGCAFSVDNMRRVFDRAGELGIPVKLHAEQLSTLGGARMAASYGPLSADPLKYLDQQGAQAIAAAGSTAVLLPGAFYAINETMKPPVQALPDADVAVAVSTDRKPGTSPLTPLLLMMDMSATMFRLTVDECFAGATHEAARALGLLGNSSARSQQIGRLRHIGHPAPG